MKGRVECATTRYGGLLVAPHTGTSEMPLLCADISTTQQTVSSVILPAINLYAGKNSIFYKMYTGT